MKQHITIEQLKELSSKDRVKLNKLWRNHGQEVNLLNHEDINIGQMIEFLFDNDFGPIITSNDMAFYWVVEPEKHLSCWSKYSFEKSELVDALWEAVKEVLRQ